LVDGHGGIDGDDAPIVVLDLRRKGRRKEGGRKGMREEGGRAGEREGKKEWLC